MRARLLGSIIAVFALALGAVIAAPTLNGASALSPGVHFSADNLPTWQTNGVVYALGQSNGKVVVGGTFSQIRPPTGGAGTATTANALAIFNAETGSPDSCQLPVTLAGGTPTIRAIVTSADGNTVYLGGNFSSIGGVTVLRVAAIDVVACSVKAMRVQTVSSFVYGLAVSGNTLYLAGAFQSVAGQERLRFASVNATSGALLPWVANTEEVGRAVAVSPDGTKVAIGGDFFSVNGQYSHSIGVVDGTTGANLRNYEPGFIPDTSITKTLYSSGDTFYGGNEGTGGGVFDGRFAIDWNTLNQKWRDNCLGATQAVLEYQGTLYSANHAHDCSQNNGYQDGMRSYFIAQNAQTAELLGWNPLGNDGTGEGIGPRALVVSTGKTTGQPYLWAGGEFTRINGVAQQGLTRFSPADTGNPPVPVVTAQASSSGGIQVRFRTVVDSDDSRLTYRVYRNNSATPIWEGTADSVWWKRPQVSFVDTSVTPGTNYSYRVRATDGTNQSTLSVASAAVAQAPGADYAAQVRADGAQIFWQYDGATGTWVQDKAGTATTSTGSPGIAEGGVGHAADSAVTGDPNGSAVFDGSDDYLWEDNYRPAPNVYSIETWIKTTTTQGGKIVGFGNGRARTGTGEVSYSGNYDRQIYMDNSGRLTFGVWIGSAATIRSANAYNDGGWHQIVATQGPTGMVLYVDGVRVGQRSTNTAQGYNGVWHVGGDNLGGWPNQPTSRHFGGQIDETSIYGGVLTQQQVLNHYSLAGGVAVTTPVPADSYGQQVYTEDPDLYWRLGESSGTTAADSSMFGVTPGTYRNSVQKNQAGILAGNSAIRTTGSQNSTVYSSSELPALNTYSTELWFRTNSTSGGKLIGFENTQTGDGSSYDKHVYMTNAGKLVFGTWIGSASTIESPLSYNNNAWHHMVAVQDASGMKLFVDGSLVGSNGNPNSEGFSGYWRIAGGNIGGWPNESSNHYFNGFFDEVAVYSHALSASEIASHYATGRNDTQAPTVPTNLTGQVVAGTVSLGWTASTDNILVAGYRVYRGTTPGFTADAASFVAEVTDTSWSAADQPIGTSYYKVAAVDAAGNLSAATSAVPVTVPDTIAPATPAAPTATLNAGSIDLSWAATTDNVGVTGYSVYRGTTAGFTADGASKIADVAGTSYTDPSPVPGTYFYRVTAADAAGNVSAASDASSGVTIVPPDTTAPSVPGGVGTSVALSTVTVSWTASTDNTGVTGYSVYRGTAPGFTVDGASKVADVTTTSFADASRPVGTYYYRVTASDAAGNVSAASAEVSATVTPPPAEPVTVTVSPSEDAMVYGATPTVNYGTNNQLSSRGAGGNSPIESFLKFALPAAPAGTTLTAASLAVRTSTDATANSADAHTWSLVSGAWTQDTIIWTNRPTTVGQTLGTLTGATAVNAPYTVTFDPSALQSVLGQTVSVRLGSTGLDNLRLWSQDATTAAYRPVLTLTYTPGSGPAPDTVAPSVPGAPSATVAASNVSLSWAASTDNVGVTGYSVYRGTSSGFAADASSKIADVAGTTYQDAGVAVGTWYYRVTARDAAGNVSAGSSATSATISAPPAQPITVALSPSEDAMVYGVAATTNYGTDAQLSSRGAGAGSPIESFLKFVVPAAPAGAVLTGASLAVRTSTDPAAGSADPHPVNLVTGDWSEPAITWNNRPTTVGALLGTLSGATATNSPYAVALDVPSVSSLIGQTASFRISSTGLDNLRLWSQNAPTVGYRPVLTLTYTPIG